MLWSSSPTANTFSPPRCRAVAGQQLEPLRTAARLVSWNSSTRMWRKRLLVVLAHSVVVAQQLVAAQQQLGEVDHAFALALLVVERRRARRSWRSVVVVRPPRLPARRPSSLALLMKYCRLLGRIALARPTLSAFSSRLMARQLVLACRGSGRSAAARPSLEVRAQHAVAQAVEGADPHAARVDRQHGGRGASASPWPPCW